MNTYITDVELVSRVPHAREGSWAAIGIGTVGSTSMCERCTHLARYGCRTKPRLILTILVTLSFVTNGLTGRDSSAPRE